MRQTTNISQISLTSLVNEEEGSGEDVSPEPFLWYDNR